MRDLKGRRKRTRSGKRRRNRPSNLRESFGYSKPRVRARRLATYHSPNRAVASPVFRASDTLYFCCLKTNSWLPSSSTSQTRLDGGEGYYHASLYEGVDSYRFVPPRSSARNVLQGRQISLGSRKRSTRSRTSEPKYDVVTQKVPRLRMQNFAFFAVL